MPELDLQALPPELQAALERVWPGAPEAQRRALLGPWVEGGWEAVWPDNLWPWQPAGRWWRPGAARDLREAYERYFGSQCRDILEARGPRLFDPAQPFFETPWTRATAALRSPVPEVFTDAEFWAITTQLFNGDVGVAERESRRWAAELIQQGATERGARRSEWWTNQLRHMEMSAKGDYL
jgi:hypothetical protein